MESKQLIEKTVVFEQLQKRMITIEEGTNEDYLFYKKEAPEGTVEDYINELITIGKQQELPIIKEIKSYFNCSLEDAILLHLFTDAALFVKNK